MSENFLTKRREPFSYMLYLAMAGSVILFSFIFFVFLRKEYLNQDIPFVVPKILWVSTIVLLLSSLFLEVAKKNLEKQIFAGFKFSLGISFVLGIIFFVCQYWAWKELLIKGYTMDKHTGASFVYVFSGLHLAHALGGIVAMSITIYRSFKQKNYVENFVFSVNPPNLLNLRLVSHYWHFLGILWILIFLFMVYHAS
jgi:cytochrome c oxidase subunit 3